MADQQAKPTPTRAWPMFNEHEMELLLVRLESGHNILMLLGAEKYEDDVRLSDGAVFSDIFARLNFSKHRSGVWILPTEAAEFNLAPLVSAIPGAGWYDATEIEIVKGRSYAQKLRAEQAAAAPQVEEVSDAIEPASEVAMPRALAAENKPAIDRLKRTVRLGLNDRGEEVYEGIAGRFIKLADETVLEEDAGAEGQLRFMRAKGDEERVILARVLIESHQGRPIRPQTFAKWANAISSKGTMGEAASQQAALRAIEIAMTRGLISPDAETAQLFEKAVMTFKGHSFIKRTNAVNDPRQFMTPAPLGLIAANILGDTTAYQAFIPAAGNGALLMGLSRGTKADAWDIDGAYAEALKRTADQARLVAATFMRDGTKANVPPHQITIAHPPVAERQVETYAGMPLTRIDLQIAMRSLAGRADNGISVFFLGGKNSPAAGQLDAVRDYLGANYELLAHAGLNGSITGGNVGDPDLYAIVVGRRLPAGHEPTALPVFQTFNTFEELYAWSEARNYAARLAQPFEAQAKAEETRSSSFSKRADAAALNNADRSLENDQQVPYVSASRVGEPTSYVPKSLEASTRQALTKLIDTVGNVDEFVMDATGWSFEELARYLTPEQVDAVAMWRYNKDIRPSGFDLGDMAGRGKGRTLATIARIQLMRGETVLFGTNKAHLHSDWFRDWKDIGSEGLFFDVKPVLMNGGHEIFDIRSPGRDVVLEATSEKAIEEMVLTGRMPDSSKLMLFTYSQIATSADHRFADQRQAMKHEHWLEEFLAKDLDPRDTIYPREARARAFIRIAEGANLVLDEAHNVNGYSNTGFNMLAASRRARNIVYSSATTAVTPPQMSMYKAIFPTEMTQSHVVETLKAGGELMMEAVSRTLVSDMRMLRRESPASELDFALVDPAPEMVAQNRELLDAVSPAVQALGMLDREIGDFICRVSQADNDQLADRITNAREIGRIHPMLRRPGFGSRRHLISRVLDTALNIDLSIERAIKHINEGRRVVFFVQSTSGSLMQEVIDDLKYDGHYPEDDAEMLDIKDMLRVYLERIMNIRVMDPDTREVIERKDINALPQEIRELYLEVRRLIDRIPDIGISPFDRLRDGILEAGFRPGEISGRRRCWRGGAYHKIDPANAVEVAGEFKADQLDAVALSTAAIEGISLHSEEGEKPTVGIEVQIGSAVQREQYVGRIWRYLGQPPILESVSNGVPMYQRLRQMANKNTQRLNANTSGDRENSPYLAGQTDLLNPVGDLAVSRLLVENPELAELVGMEEQLETVSKHKLIYGEVPQAATRYMVSKFMLQAACLPCDDQEKWERALNDIYADIMLDIENRGLSTVPREIPGVWKIKSQSEFSKPRQYRQDTEFNKSVDLIEMESVQQVKPMRSEALMERIAIGESSNPAGSIDQALSVLEERRKWTLARLVDDGNVAEALLDERSPAFKKNAEIEELRNAIVRIRPGAEIEYFNEGTQSLETGIVTRVTPPRRSNGAEGIDTPTMFADAKVITPSAWKLEIVKPGDETGTKITFETVLSAASYKIKDGLHGPKVDDILEEFDNAPEGDILVSRYALIGNEARAVEIGRNHKLGKVATFRTEDGVRHMCVLVTRKEFNPLILPVNVPLAHVAREYLELKDGNSLFSVTKGTTSEWKIFNKDGRILIDLPRQEDHKLAYKELVQNKAYMAEKNQWGKKTRSLDITDSFEAIYQALTDEALVPMYAPSAARNWINQKHVQYRGYVPGVVEVELERPLHAMAM